MGCARAPAGSPPAPQGQLQEEIYRYVLAQSAPIGGDTMLLNSVPEVVRGVSEEEIRELTALDPSLMDPALVAALSRGSETGTEVINVRSLPAGHPIRLISADSVLETNRDRAAWRQMAIWGPGIGSVATLTAVVANPLGTEAVVDLQEVNRQGSPGGTTLHLRKAVTGWKIVQTSVTVE